MTNKNSKLWYEIAALGSVSLVMMQVVALCHYE